MTSNDVLEMYFSPVIPSPDDPRDHRVGARIDIPEEFPEEFAVWQPPVEDQGQVGNCVAQSIANIYETWDNREGAPHRDFSVGYIYGTSDSYGMVPREACAAAIKEGDVLRETWECLAENPECYEERQTVPEAIKRTARKFDEYVRIYSLAELKSFLVQYRVPVLIIAKGADYAWYASGGYHATACYGWDKNNMLLYTNSWGTGGAFGDGKGKMEFSKLTEAWGLIPMTKKRFTDIEGRWSEKDILALADKGIVNGYPNGTILPLKNITREEVFVTINHAVEYLEATKK